MYQGNNSNNNMLQTTIFQNNQNGPNMNKSNNNFNLQDSNSTISLAKFQHIPINPNWKKLKIQLSNDEQMFYSKLYSMLDSINCERILGKPAVKFNKKIKFEEKCSQRNKIYCSTNK